jgi:hypothetical protein
MKTVALYHHWLKDRVAHCSYSNATAAPYKTNSTARLWQLGGLVVRMPLPSHRVLHVFSTAPVNADT